MSAFKIEHIRGAYHVSKDRKDICVYHVSKDGEVIRVYQFERDAAPYVDQMKRWDASSAKILAFKKGVKP